MIVSARHPPLTSPQEASSFFKKRAAVEDEYGRNLQKVARATSETYSMNDGKAGWVYLYHIPSHTHLVVSQFLCLSVAVLYAGSRNDGRE